MKLKNKSVYERIIFAHAIHERHCREEQQRCLLDFRPIRSVAWRAGPFFGATRILIQHPGFPIIARVAIARGSGDFVASRESGLGAGCLMSAMRKNAMATISGRTKSNLNSA